MEERIRGVHDFSYALFFLLFASCPYEFLFFHGFVL